jgi:hypothetical protein
MNALTVLPLSGNFPFTREVLFDPEALGYKIVNLLQQPGQSPLPVIDGRLGHTYQPFEFGSHLLFLIVGSGTDDIA